MGELIVLWDWAAFLIRWLHVITAMAWIGTSFYFIALDLGLRKVPNLPKGAQGEEWQVHGGGFYHIQKYLVAPENLPQHLVWFKWESYATWLSGAALLMVVYWAGAELYLIDHTKAPMPVWQAIAVSALSLAAGWVIYDQLCKSRLANYPTALMLLLFVILIGVSWGYTQIFTGRAALLHLGAFTATLMTGNVFFIIMPNQRIVVAALKAGDVPDKKYGVIAKLRSTHNNYLTLPVIFLMLSNHYPLAFATPYNWAIASLIFLIGVLIRHHFNALSAGRKAPYWTWAVATLLVIVIGWLSALPREKPETLLSFAAAAPFLNHPDFADVEGIVLSRCAMCHAREPLWRGIRHAPGGVFLEQKSDIAQNAQAIYLQAGISHAMPPGNITGLPENDRKALVAWYRGALNHKQLAK